MLYIEQNRQDANLRELDELLAEARRFTSGKGNHTFYARRDGYCKILVGWG